MARKRVAKKIASRSAYFALIVATGALVVNFWAWSLLSPLGVRYSSELSLDTTTLSFLLAIPVVVGSLGRIILGALTDRFGGRLVFGITCLAAMIPVVGLAFAHDYNQLVTAAVLLGVGGATFAIGVPFVGGWFPTERRGFVLGIYSMGNVGTAISGLLTPQLDTLVGRTQTFLLVAGLLFILAVVILGWAKNAPNWKPAKKSAASQLMIAAKNRITWDLAVLYVITFGALVAFGVYLPVLLKVAYDLSIADAAARAAGFVLVATIARPVGGWLSDHVGGRLVIKIGLAVIVLLASAIAFQPTLEIQTTASYLSLAFVLGCCNGAIVALIGKLAQPGNIGSTIGIVGALGGLGGFLPPLILGLSYQRTHSYALALVLLAVSAMVVFVYINHRFSDRVYATARA